MLALPAFRRLLALPPDVRDALASILDELATDARARAQKSWTTHKGPMALYWKSLATYAGHLRKALRRGLPE